MRHQKVSDMRNGITYYKPSFRRIKFISSATRLTSDVARAHVAIRQMPSP